VIKRLKKQWCDLKNGRPGHRFEDRYEANKKGRSDESALRQWLQPALGIMLFAAGIFFCIFPGPGLPLLLPGAMLLAERSQRMSRALDWSELKVRSVIRRWKGWWREASLAAKNGVVVMAAAVIAAAGYGAWQVVFGN
jgi:hypothetical protein